MNLAPGFRLRMCEPEALARLGGEHHHAGRLAARFVIRSFLMLAAQTDFPKVPRRMKPSRCLPRAAAFSIGLFSVAAGASAQLLYSDNFDNGTSGANWTVNRSAADAVVDFGFDYSTLGIPSAPHSSGGSTIGLRFIVNQSAGVFQGASASPTGGSFLGDYSVHFDMWLNFVGPAPVGGSGSTQLGSFGIGTTGTTTEWAGGSSSIMFAVTTDGNSAQDYRVYTNNVHVSPLTGVYAAGVTTSPDSRNAADPYYAQFGGKTAPAAQVALFPQQSGTTGAGVAAWAWHDVQIDKVGDLVTWSIDGLRIATVSTNGTMPGSDIFLGMFDSNAGSSTDPNDFLTTAIYDNVTVSAVPEPSTYALGLLGVATFFLLRRRAPQ